MSHTTAEPEVRGSAPIRWPEVFLAALAIAFFAFWVVHFQYKNSLGGDDDPYRVIDGLMDGARNGTGFASPLHYGTSFSFGYIMAMYRFVSPEIVRNPQPLIALVNQIGAISAIMGALFFWMSVWLLYNLRVATVAVTVFALSPMMLELGTTGHQVLPAFAFFAAGSVLLFLPVRGWRFALASAGSCVLLIAALVTRAEVLLAFPFLVLAPAEFRSLRSFLRSALLHCVAPGIAAVAFFLLKHYLVDRLQKSQLGTFLSVMSKVSAIPSGIVVYLLGCGLVTTAIGVFAAVRLCRDTLAAQPGTERRHALVRTVAGPLVLLLPSLLFWILNPFPARHFLLCLAGMGMLIGLLLDTLVQSKKMWVYAGALAIVLGNQIFAKLSGPFVLKHYPSNFTTIPGLPRSVPMRVTIGSSLDYHRTVEAQLRVTDIFAEKILNTCDRKTLILTAREPQVFSHLYEVSTPWVVETLQWNKVVLKSAHFRDRTIVVIWEPADWPNDTAAEVLAEPALQDYKLARDPGSIAIYDKAVIPAERLARFDCQAE